MLYIFKTFVSLLSGHASYIVTLYLFYRSVLYVITLDRHRNHSFAECACREIEEFLKDVSTYRTTLLYRDNFLSVKFENCIIDRYIGTSRPLHNDGVISAIVTNWWMCQ